MRRKYMNRDVGEQVKSDGFDRTILDRDWFEARWTDMHYFKRDWFDKKWIHRSKFGKN